MVFSFSKYKQLQKELYPNIIEHDYLRHYFTERFTINNNYLIKIGDIEKKVNVDFGERKLVTVKLKPTTGVVKRLGDEFCNEALTHFGRDYWLVALWLTMYEDSKNNQLAREILRAFIKTCICRASRELIVSANKDISKESINKSLPSKLNFYSMVFSSSEVYKNMRTPYKAKLKMHSSEQSVKQLDSYLDFSISPDTPNLKDIFANVGLSDYSALITLSSRYASKEELKTIRRTVSIFINNLSGKRKLKKELGTLIKMKG
ncbi:TPA: hypothetical protein NJ344_001367 [Vibrio parahaemolyticus]|uniref:hypothetical protein n=1 Tax=Vibrio campbellii TaxID=680 RepID=UPI000CD36056|nr:hypothetical protein [Vibrio campbellii]MBE3925162.1 hypothetical protein [Vibrio parahaemolyticus]AUV86076.1 hypothetical protein C1N50_07935 [Vibrio campbellii]MDF4712960.1 hypothetical protein [Vibrio parahaemolyticus]HCG7123217.1 hypothetical protein [Vibrio parahaemolyticus]HCG7767821.1 hypothetical protein [Vibrio parahaemolyticus]